MTDRSEHDAFARVEALELEAQRLEAENARLRAVREKPSKPAAVDEPEPPGLRALNVVLGGAVVAIYVIARLGILYDRQSHDDRPSRSETERSSPTEGFAAPVPHPSLTKCVLAIKGNPLLDANLTDPHAAAPMSVDAIKATAAPCRDDLQLYRDSGLADLRERAAIERWLAAENDLAGAISRILVYYGSDPYLHDGYWSAPQLWIEFDRAVAHRDVALADWRRRSE